MTDNPQDRSEERRRTGRTGPLGEDAEGQSAHQSSSGDETRQIPTDEGSRFSERESPERDISSDETRQVETGSSSGTSGEAPGEASSGANEGEKETRVIRTPNDSRRARRERGESFGDTSRDLGAQGTQQTQSGSTYSRGYLEAADDRLERLRDAYGGVDWLAAFLGFVFAAVAGSVLFGIVSLIVVPLGISVQIGGTLGAAAITALVLLAVLIFVTYLFGGYVAGRLARFDGGRNGAVSVVWAIIIGLIIFAVGTFLPGAAGNAIRDFYQGNLLPRIGDLLQLGVVGIVVIVAALLVALLGGIVGGKLGSRYHAEIDRTT